MRIETAPAFKCKHVQNLIFKKSTRAYKYHATSRFIDELCAINKDGELSEYFTCIYSEELELKLGHSATYATFLNLEIKIKDGIFVYKLFDKKDKFPFSIVCMLHFDFESNIPSSILYGSICSELFIIARCTLKLEQFLLRTSELYSRVL